MSQFWHHIWCSRKTLKISIESVLTNFDDLHRLCDVKIGINMCEPHYFNFFVNLLHSPSVWFFDIWYIFDNLTSFGHFTSTTSVCHRTIFMESALKAEIEHTGYRYTLYSAEKIIQGCLCNMHKFQIKFENIKTSKNSAIQMYTDAM